MFRCHYITNAVEDLIAEVVGHIGCVNVWANHGPIEYHSPIGNRKYREAWDGEDLLRRHPKPVDGEGNQRLLDHVFD